MHPVHVIQFLVPLVAVIGACCFGVQLWSAYRDHEGRLRHEVESAGLVWCGSRVPRFWERGPGPLIELRAQPRQVSVAGFSGQWTVRRVVRVRDRGGREHEVWAYLRHVAFRLNEVEFRPPLDRLASGTAGPIV